MRKDVRATSGQVSPDTGKRNVRCRRCPTTKNDPLNNLSLIKARRLVLLTELFDPVSRIVETFRHMTLVLIYVNITFDFLNKNVITALICYAFN